MGCGPIDGLWAVRCGVRAPGEAMGCEVCGVSTTDVPQTAQLKAHGRSYWLKVSTSNPGLLSRKVQIEKENKKKKKKGKKRNPLGSAD